MSILATLLNIILPARCVGCRRPEEYLCENCLSLLPPADTSDQPGTVALFDYSDARVRRAIWLLKYRGARSVAKIFAQALHERLLETLADTTTLYPGGDRRWQVVPVPLSIARAKKRGFNQAAQIARELCKLNPDILNLNGQMLLKTKETPTQVSIKNRANRLKNLRGAFALLRSDLAKDANVILIDDVTTTGATLAECARVLEHAGAKRILKTAIAHG